VGRNITLISNFCKALSVSVKPVGDHTATNSEKIPRRFSNLPMQTVRFQVTAIDAYYKYFSLGFVT
jgi:hypothetical protein